jgi:hypothetical protein
VKSNKTYVENLERRLAEEIELKNRLMQEVIELKKTSN